MPLESGKSRLAYIDWMRGLACLLMFQTHCYDSWLGGAARRTAFFMYSQLGGTFPAPLFLFLAGMSVALVIEKLQQKNLSAWQVAGKPIWRGAEVLGLGLLFRVQEYVLAWGWSPKTDMFRVDILNNIGVSMMLLGALCWIVLALVPGEKLMWRQPPSAVEPGEARLAAVSASQSRGILIAASAFTALTISLLTPLLWSTWRPNWLPWPIESYIDGVPNQATTMSALFPIFPWTAFAFAGLAVGFLLQTAWARSHEARIFFSLGATGVGFIEVSRWLDREPRQLYPVYDYWHTSPNFFLIRVGMLLMILTASYVWCRWGAAQKGFSPLITLGQASLLVYWVHIEFVYGRVSILPKHKVGIPAATAGLLVITVAMVALAHWRTKKKKEKKVAVSSS